MSSPLYGSDGVRAERYHGGFVSEPDRAVPRRSSVRKDQDELSIGIFEGGVVEIRRLALGVDAVCAAVDETGIVGEGPVLSAVGNFSAAGIDGDQAAAIERPDVGTAFLIEREVPGGN